MYQTGQQEIYNWYLRVIDMSKEKILHFIKENRDLIKDAPVEQKIRLLKLIRESLDQSNHGEPTQASQSQIPSNSDYLDER